VVILPAAGQRVEWAVENQLAASARDRAGRISFHGPMGDTTTTDPDAPIDSAQASAPKRAPRTSIDTHPIDPTAHLLEYRAPLLPSRNVSRILEPAIVVGLVSGLVFLFYTNRN